MRKMRRREIFSRRKVSRDAKHVSVRPLFCEIFSLDKNEKIRNFSTLCEVKLGKKGETTKAHLADEQSKGGGAGVADREE